MMDPAEIRVGLGDNLRSIDGLLVYDAEPASPKPPCAWPWPDEPFIEREAMHKGVLCMHYKIAVLVAAADTEYGIEQLDSYLVTSGAGSVWAAIESDQSLGGAASDAIVQEVRRWDGNYIVAGNAYFAAELLVTVYGTG